MNHRIRKILEYAKGPSVLDVGCVGGNCNPDSPHWLHRHLRQKFPDVIGIDVNGRAIEKLRSMGFDCREADAERFELGRKFDSIVAGEVIEHLSNPGDFLNSARRHLNLGGRLIVTTPYPFSAMNISYAILKYPKTCSHPEHTMWFCPATLAELAGRYGYRYRWELVEDYYEDVDSLLYRIFLKVRYLFPKRLRYNCMLFILEWAE